ncbi:helix-turn-helix domain-containing protein [Dactylosporangium sp. NBC_01737]|uniref:IclR family transcriptional regulator n=1 Tax=Dactylosporangium sp. NBC_01737 TaxID=2975959 RepID=UPI002E0D26B2|nr:helix-turn-helix domain-containing protein [Dactylosporangium sp. NBC_01737]
MAVKGVQSLATGLRVLELVSRHQPVGASEVARLMGLHKSVVHRALITLGEEGWIRQFGEPPAVRWVVTGRALSVGSAFAAEAAAREQAHQLLRQLSAESGETVLLSVRDGDRLLVVDAVESTQPLKVTFPVGTSTTIDLETAAGEALLAGMGDPEVAELLGDEPAQAWLPRRADYERRGYAMQLHPASPLWAVATHLPVAPDGSATVVVIAVPQHRCDRSSLERLGERLVELARITRRTG